MASFCGSIHNIAVPSTEAASNTYCRFRFVPVCGNLSRNQKLGRTPHVSRLVALAIKFQSLVSSGSVRNYRELAEVGHVSRPRLSQIMKLAQLAPEIQEKLLFLPPTFEGPDRVFERHLRFLASVIDWEKQKELFRSFEADRASLPS